MMAGTDGTLATRADQGGTFIERWMLAPVVAAFGFFLPMGPAGVSITLALLLVAAVALYPRLAFKPAWRNPVVAIGVALFAWTTLHTVWTSGFAWREAIEAVNRYHELLLPLLLIPLLHGRAREPFLQGLVAGVLVWAALHWVALAYPPLAVEIGPRRISAGWTLATSAFLMLVLAPARSRPWLWRLGAGFLALTVLFAIGGRTGHIVLLALLALAAVLQAPRGRRLPTALAVLLAVAVLAVASPKVRERAAETWTGSAQLDGTALSSTDIRVQLALTALAMAREHGLTGVGHTRVAERHAEVTLERLHAQPSGRHHQDEFWVRLDNPHNEYLMQLIATGAVGFALFLAWVAAPLRQPGSRPDRHALLGLVVAFAIGCLFNSLLRDFIEGHYYAAVLSWLLARTREA
ncbi:O-antigen ligase family protein [Ramlibacter rhizophilus]|uniref:O-antigen ligase family protein n=1 Tax=Ramlibacter rhizophilus TaxID=1781167 RepID=A0A4Z0C0U9_9BURK|nr:O-antigen ligase family protein [Ramlibacter rhizophilus]TFZ04841.1 O-antigen ligase family protein [Ramlibacter rhizophilus]